MSNEKERDVLARVEDLTVSFPGQARPALERISWEIAAGECVALVGESGSGKSLTARALLGLLPRASVSSGRILLAPHGRLEEVPNRGSRDWNSFRGEWVGLVPQDALGGLDPLRRIEAEVGDPLRLHSRAFGKWRRQEVQEALRDAGIPEAHQRMRQRSYELSGGLRQRALIATAVIAQPCLIIADEPTTALDAGYREVVLQELRRRVEGGAGALVITHDLASMREVADRILVMREGRIVEEGPPEVILDAPRHPFTRALQAASLPAPRERTTRKKAVEALSQPTRVTRGSAEKKKTAQREGWAKEVPERSAQADVGVSFPPGIPSLPASQVPRLALDEVFVTFGKGEGRRDVLRGASLRVNQDETVGLVGESGSGKTTLLRVALGLQVPTRGRVEVDGIDRLTASRQRQRELRRRIAFVPQDPLDSFPPGATGQAILRDALRAAGVPRGEREERMKSLAREVRIDESQLQRPAASFSGGERQRLAIIRALARDPQVLLLDEPVSALDLTVQATVLDLLNELQSKRGTSYLLVSHDKSVIDHMSDRILHLEDGQISEE